MPSNPYAGPRSARCSHANDSRVGRRVGVLVVVDDVDDRQAAHAGQVHRLVHVAARGRAVAAPADRDPRLAAQLEGQRDAGDDRDHGRQVADAGQQAHDRARSRWCAGSSRGRRWRRRSGPCTGRRSPPGRTPRTTCTPMLRCSGEATSSSPIARGDADRRGLVAAAGVVAAGQPARLEQQVAALLDRARGQHVAVDGAAGGRGRGRPRAPRSRTGRARLGGSLTCAAAGYRAGERYTPRIGGRRRCPAGPGGRPTRRPPGRSTPPPARAARA